MSKSTNAIQSRVAPTFLNCCKKSSDKRKCNIFLRFILSLIKVYRSCLSPLLPASCRFYPTCSAYALEAYQTLGLVRGTYLIFLRILKCNPLHPGGADPVPVNADSKQTDSSVIL